MQEAGEFVIRDVSGRTPLHRAIGKPIRAVYALEVIGKLIGVRLDCGDSIAPVLFISGDELVISDEAPLVLAGEGPVIEKPL